MTSAIPVILLLAAPAAPAQERPDTKTVTACVAREADYVRPRPNEPARDPNQMVLTSRDSAKPAYNVTGRREQELAALVGKRVELSGVVEEPRTMPVPTGVNDAHEQPEARPTATTGTADPARIIATLPRLNVTSFRVVNGSCVAPTPAALASQPVQPANGEAAPAAGARQSERVTARGCLVRQTSTGTALTAQRQPNETLALTRASLAPEQVPADSPDAGTPAAFALALSATALQDLTPRVGERVEVTGVLQTQQTPPDTAHPSAPVRTISVDTFRLLGGSCQ